MRKGLGRGAFICGVRRSLDAATSVEALCVAGARLQALLLVLHTAHVPVARAAAAACLCAGCMAGRGSVQVCRVQGARWPRLRMPGS